MMRAVLGICFLLALGAQGVLAFSGNGLELLQQARAYLLLDKGTGELADVGALDKVERLDKAIELLTQAADQTVNDREKQIMNRYLGKAHNELACEYDARKDFPNAIETERKAIEYAGDATPVLHANLGGMYFEAGDYYAAAESLQRARELNTNPELRTAILNKLVSAYIKDGQTRDRNSYQSAIRTLEEEISETPDNPDLLMALGYAHQYDGDNTKALEAWDRARQLKPFEPAQEEAYRRLKGTATVKKEFAKTSSHHFIIEFDDAAHSGLAERILEKFEQANDDLGPVFGVGMDGEKVRVTVYTNADFDRAVRVPWAGGVHQANRIDLRVNPKWTDEDYVDTIRHEFTHHLVSLKAAGKPVATWLQEGFAMHQERKLDIKPFYRGLGAALKSKRVLPLSDIEGSFEELPPQMILVAYAESYDFVRYLLERHSLGQLQKMLEALAQGNATAEAFESALGTSLSDAEKGWRTWLDERAEQARAKARAQQASAPAVHATTSAAPPTFGGLTEAPQR